MNILFYHCDICGKDIFVLSDNGIPTECCGQEMTEVKVNYFDGAGEKHVPVFHTEGNKVTVKVGSVSHPMTEEHLIMWIGLRTDRGFQFRELHEGDAPEACFTTDCGERAEAAYAFCNIHGLWSSEAGSETEM